MGESKLEGFVELYQESTHKFQESEKARVADVLEYQCWQKLMEMWNSDSNNIAEEVKPFNNHFLLICALLC